MDDPLTAPYLRDESPVPAPKSIHWLWIADLALAALVIILCLVIIWAALTLRGALYCAP